MTSLARFAIIRESQDDPFRGAYGQIGNLRGFVHSPVLCLTATAGIKTRREIMKSLHMRNVKVSSCHQTNQTVSLLLQRPRGILNSSLNLWLKS